MKVDIQRRKGIGDGWGARIRTWAWRDQNPLPYRLATPQNALIYLADIILVREVRIELTHLTVPEPKSGAST